MEYKTEDECLTSIQLDWRMYYTSLLASTAQLRAILTIIQTFGFFIMVMMAILMLPAFGYVKLNQFIIYVIAYLLFWITQLCVRNYSMNHSLEITKEKIIDMHLKQWKQYQEMPEWMQKKIMDEDIMPSLK